MIDHPTHVDTIDDMFVLEVTYTAPLDDIHAVFPEHKAWMEQHYAAGTFLASGRKPARDGAVIIAVGGDRAAMEALVETDPCRVKDLCTYRVVEFIATSTAPALEAHRQ